MFEPAQKDHAFLKHLPYGGLIDSEASRHFEKIKTSLGLCVVYREMGKPLKFWLKQLSLYINLYKLKFSKDDHIKLVKLLYELLTVPNLPFHIVSMVYGPLYKMLKSLVLLPRRDLTLSWKPLYSLMKKVSAGAKYDSTLRMSVKTLVTVQRELLALTEYARFYFDSTATQEILEELRPLLCPFDRVAMESATILTRFLPLTDSPELADSSYKLWLPEMMQLWEAYSNHLDWDEFMMDVLSKVASLNIGYIDWGEYLPTMYARFQSSFGLPVYYKDVDHSRRSDISKQETALWIVSTLGGDMRGQEYLDQLLGTLESYCQPANEGDWTSNITSFLTYLVYFFHRRIRREHCGRPLWRTKVPEDTQLKNEDIRRFVVSMQSIAMTATFTMSSFFADFCAIFRKLAELRVDIIVPPLLDRLYSTIDCPTEPHRFTVALQCVCSVARPMLNGSLNRHSYDEGKKHVIPLLFAALSELNSVDLGRAEGILSFITTFLKMVPVEDCSSIAQFSDHTQSLEKEIARTTSRFEEFVLLFMDRVFAFVENVADEENVDFNGDKEPDATLERVLESMEDCCHTVIGGSSPEIFEVALKKFNNYIMGKIFEVSTAGPVIAGILKAFAETDAERTYGLFIPALCEHILDASRGQPTNTNEENVDQELLCKMLLLKNIVQSGSPLALKQYLPMLMNVVDKTLQSKCEEYRLHGGCILENALKALVHIHPLKYRRQCQSETTRQTCPSLVLQEWGRGTTYENLNIRWYVPGEEEISMVEQIFWKYLTPELARIDKYNKDEVDLSRDDIRCALDTILILLTSCVSVLKPLTEEPWPIDDRSSVPYASMELELGVTRHFLMPDGGNVFKALIDTLVLFQRKLSRISSDATGFRRLNRAFMYLFNVEAIPLMHYEKLISSVENARDIFKNKLLPRSSNLRSVLTHEVYRMHIYRMSLNANVLTQTHKSALVSLLNSTTSDYEMVQRGACAILQFALPDYADSSFVVDRIVDNLKADTTENVQRLNGTLALLQKDGSWYSPISSSFEQLKAILPAIVNSKPIAEDESVMGHLDNLLRNGAEAFWQFAVNIEIPDNVVAEAKKLWVESKLSRPLPSDEEIAAGRTRLKTSNKKAKCDFEELIAAMIQAVESKNLSWIHELAAANFMVQCVLPNEDENPPEVARYFLNMLLHSSSRFRKYAISVVSRILKRYKPKTMKEIVDPFALSGAESSTIVETGREYLTPGPRPDNEWCRYSEKSVPTTEVEWNKARYSYHCYYGFYGWPKDLLLRSSPPNQPTNNVDFDSLSGVGKEIDLFFLDESKIAKFVEYLCLEGDDEEPFGESSIQLFKNLFKIHCDRYLEIFKPHVEAVLARKEHSYQVCAGEMLSGIIMGAKLWPYDKAQKLIAWYMPLLKRILDEGATLTQINWGTAMADIMFNFDVNKNGHLFNVLMDEPIRGDSVTTRNCERLWVLQGIRYQSWRLCEIWSRLLELIKPHLANRYQDLRCRLAFVLVNIFETDIEVNGYNQTVAPRVKDFIEYLLPKLHILYSISADCNCPESGGGDGDVEKVMSDDALYAIQLLKTVCEWCTRFTSTCVGPLKRDFFKLFPMLCLMENYKMDDELKTCCEQTLSGMCCAIILRNDIPVFLHAFDKVCGLNSWRARCSGLDFLQVFIVNNLFLVLSREEWVPWITENVLRLLVDYRSEVRLKAGEVMSSMFHYRIIKDPSTLIEKFKRYLSSEHNASINENRSNIRHAGAIGLCSFINAYPYTVPPEMPPLLDDIGEHLMDLEPIAGIIRKTLDNFKRTHSAEWERLKWKFTDDQLGMLADLVVPPDHYA